MNSIWFGLQDGTCDCDTGFGGRDCSQVQCPNNCTAPNGVCDLKTGICSCGTGFSGGTPPPEKKIKPSGTQPPGLVPAPL